MNKDKMKQKNAWEERGEEEGRTGSEQAREARERGTGKGTYQRRGGGNAGRRVTKRRRHAFSKSRQEGWKTGK